jgi:hypothetical protein
MTPHSVGHSHTECSVAVARSAEPVQSMEIALVIALVDSMNTLCTSLIIYIEAFPRIDGIYDGIKYQIDEYHGNALHIFI